MREERRAALTCSDCGAPFDPERKTYSCVPESGPGVFIITEDQMAGGEQVALTRRVYLDESRTQAVPAEAKDDSPVAAWLYGGPGTLVSKEEAERMGLTAGADFEEAKDPRTLIAEQEQRNRETMRRSEATIIMPGPIQTATNPTRDEFHRETGGSLDEGDAKAGSPSKADLTKAPAAGSPSPMPQRGGGASRT